MYGKYVGRSPGKRTPRILKKNAVPTIFKKSFEKPAVKERESSVRRRKAKEHNEASITAAVALYIVYHSHEQGHCCLCENVRKNGCWRKQMKGITGILLNTMYYYVLVSAAMVFTVCGQIEYA